MVVPTNEAVQYEYLGYDIGDIKNLANKIGDDQVVAMTATTNWAADTRHAAGYAESTAVFDGLLARKESAKKEKHIFSSADKSFFILNQPLYFELDFV